MYGFDMWMSVFLGSVSMDFNKILNNVIEKILIFSVIN